MNSYIKCHSCGQYINTVTTDHYVVKLEDGSDVRLHMRPCAQFFREVNVCEIIQRVFGHQHRS